MKKKLFLLMTVLCCFVLAVGILAACNGNESEQPDVIDPNATYYTVTFDLNGGDGSIAPRDYAAGYKMELPTPTRDGYRFVGWQDAFGEKFDNSSLMPDNDLILYAQWEPVVTSYEDEFVYFKPATEGVKDPDTKLEYDDLDLTGFVYVELTSDMLGGRHKVGEENNFDFTRGVEMEYSVKSGYTLQWWRDRDFSVANGAQRFTLNYGSNFQFLTVSSNQQTRATYLIDFYVLHDYQVKLHTNIYDENPYETVWVIENRTFASDTEAYQMKDFEFDKRVYWDEEAGWGEWKAFDYSTPITQDWDLYQTYKPYTVEAELDDGTLDGELSIIPYTEYQQLPVPEKEGYDFIGWQLPDAENDKEDYFADITGFNSTLLLGGGRSTRTNVYFDTLTAVWLPKHYHKVTDGDEVSFEETVPVVTYTDRSMNEINEVIYVVKGTPYVLPEKVVYEGSLEFCGWKVWTQDNGGDYYGETFDFDAEVTVPAAMWQDMEVIGGSSSVKGLYLNDSRTFSSLGIGQRIKAYLPAQGDYTFTVTTTGTVSFDYNNYGYYATSSKPVTFTVTNEKPYDGLQVFLDVASYTGSFTIKFEGPTGTAEAPSESIADAVYAVGDAVTAPQKSGYTFVGWYDADGTKLSEEGSFDFAMPAFDPDAVYTAKWQRCATKLAVNDADAGSVSGLEGTTVVGAEMTVTAETNPGYTFIGWYNGDEKVADTLTYEFTMSAENVTYTAKWIKVVIESEDDSKGTVSELTEEYLPGDEVSVTATTNPGYTFIGWYNGDEKVADTLTYEFTMSAENVTYTAKWIKVTITSESTDKGTVPSLTGKYLPGDEVSVTATTKSGYTFIGWYNGDVKVADTLTYEFTMPAENVTYTAKWIKVVIESEDDAKGTVSGLTDTYVFGEKVSVTATTKSGYTFIGWYNGDVKVADTLTYEFTMPAENVTYIAKWIKVTITSESTAKGTVSKLTGTYFPGEKVSVTAETKSGYTFIGWYKGDEKVADTLTYEFTMPAENVTYTAKWIKVTVVSESTTKGTVSSLTDKYLPGDEVSVTATTKSGYTFIGWYNGDVKVADTLTYEFTMPAENVTYTAKWIKVVIESEDDAKGTVSGLTDTYVFGEKVSVTATANLGYTFIGWYKGDEKVADGLTCEFTMPAENATYTAKWMLNAEMEPFIFTSTPTSLAITGVTDNGVTSLDVPSYVTGIRQGAFQNCSSLESITLPFVGATKNGTSNAHFGYIFGAWNSTLNYSYVPDSLKEVIITGGTSIDDYAFRGCRGLTSVTIPDSVTRIGSSAFSECSGLTSVTIPDSVTSIGKYAFEYCSGLTSVIIGNGVTSIVSGVFKGCNNIKSATMPTMAINYVPQTQLQIVVLTSGTSIFDEAFYNCTRLTSVTIPNSVTSIGYAAFYNCTRLASITFPDSVTSIGDVAFQNCSSLTSITFPDSMTSIGSSAFYNCSGLTSVTISDSVTSIDYSAFLKCSSLTSIYYTGDMSSWLEKNWPEEVMSSGRTLYIGGNKVEGEIIIPNGTTSISSYAFAYQTGITTVVIPDGVTSIGSYAFEDCSGLTSVTIPDSVTGIGDSAFEGCSSITSATMPTLAIDYIPQESLQTVVLTSGESIGISAFSGCSGLTSVTIPDSVTSIGEDAFSDCSGLISIYYTGDMSSWCGITGLDNIMSSKRELYMDGNKVEGEIIIPNGVTSIPSYAFAYRTGITSVTISDSVTSIANSAFYKCSSLTSVTIGDAVTSIGQNAFYNCNKLIEVYNKSSLDIRAGTSENGYVGYYAKHIYTEEGGSWFTDTSDGFRFFYDGEQGYLMGYLGAETEIELPASFMAYNGTPIEKYAIYNYAFSGCSGLTSITIGDAVTSIGSSAFSGCSGLTSITIGDAVTSIGSSAFSGCSGLTSVTIPDSVTSIVNSAFYNCSSLTSVTIGDAVTSIGQNAFYNCNKLIEVYNKSSLDIRAGTSENGYVGYYAKHIYTEEGGSWFTDTSDGFRFFYDGEQGYLMGYLGTETEIELPASFTAYNGTLVESYAVYDFAFYRHSNLTSVIIPDSVTSIGSYAFEDCTNLIEKENGVSYVDGWAMDFDGSVSSVALREGTRGIAARAFYNCSSLTSVTIPDSVTSIGDYAFYGCSGLTSITIPDRVTSIGSSAFYNCVGLTSVTIPNRVTSIGDYAFSGCSGLTSVTIGDAVTSIGDLAFSGCSGLTSVTIPDSVTSIGIYAFSGCSGLTSVTIGDAVTSIGNYAFNGCYGLTSITIPDSVTSIGYKAFYSCSRLTSVIFEETAGWYRASSSTATSGTEISRSDLSDPAKAAEWLTSTYQNYYWKRNV